MALYLGLLHRAPDALGPEWEPADPAYERQRLRLKRAVDSVWDQVVVMGSFARYRYTNSRYIQFAPTSYSWEPIVAVGVYDDDGNLRFATREIAMAAVGMHATVAFFPGAITFTVDNATLRLLDGADMD